MRTISLTQGLMAMVDDEDYEWLSAHGWYACRIGRTFYAAKNRPTGWGRRGLILMHRMVAEAPSGVLVDHKDHDGLNNVRSNLRLGSKVENGQNRRPQTNGSSAFKGVHWSSRREHWIAKTRVEGQNVYLGQFESEEAAALAYDQAAQALFGEFAFLNFPVEA